MVFSLFQSQPPAREKRQINLAGRFYTLAINRRQNAHRMTMRIRDRNISLTIPFGINDAEINHFLAANQEWIDAQIADQENALADALPGQGKTPMIYYKGVPTEIILIRDPSHQNRSKIEPGLNSLTIYMHAESRLRPVKVLENHLRQEARQLIRYHLDRLLPLLGEDPVPIAIRDQKTRWGSCSSTRRLSFNWRLVMSPPESLEYVVAHEAVHLIHHDHSSRFWGKLAEVMPDYKMHQQWLRDHQTVLFADLERCLNGLRPQTAPPMEG